MSKIKSLLMMNFSVKIWVTLCITIFVSACSIDEKHYVKDIPLPAVNVDLFKCKKLEWASVAELHRLRNKIFGNIEDTDPKLLSIETFELNESLSGIFHIIDTSNEYRDKVWNPHKNYISKIDNKFNAYNSVCPGWRKEDMDAPIHSDKAFFGLIVDGRRYIYIKGQYGSVGPENTGMSLKSSQSQYEEIFKSWFWEIADGGHGIFTAVFDVELGAFVWIQYNGYA